MEQTPAKSGYRMPAEWHPHAATLLHWPSNRQTWPADRLQRVEEVFLEIIDVLHRFEPVILLAAPESVCLAENRLKQRSLDQTRIHLLEQPVNDVWARDCGPLFVHRRSGGSDEYAITDWEYNAWGEKYLPYDDDNRLPAFFSDTFDLPLFRSGMVLEGGSVETNGEGLLLTTESVLLHPNRNPAMEKADIEQRLKDYLGAEHIWWLKGGLAGDDTDGHIDTLARFLDEKTLLAVISDEPDDKDHVILENNYRKLMQMNDSGGSVLQIVKLPLPETKTEDLTADGSAHMPASYANFYIANGVVLLPLYDPRYDDQALEFMDRYFPDRHIAGIQCADLVWGQGSIHCITQPLYGIEDFLYPAGKSQRL